jgi:hypothetical protein
MDKDKWVVAQPGGAAQERRPWRLQIPERRPPLTAHDASAQLQESDGAAALIEAAPSLLQPVLWSELAYFDVQGLRGSWAEYVEFWDADVGGFSLFELFANDFIFFAGASWPTAPGRVFCYFDVPIPQPETFPLPRINCTFGIRLYGYGPETWPAEEPVQAHVGFFIDDQPVGEREFEHYADTVLNLQMTPGSYVFEIRQLPESGSFLFQSATIWQSLIPALGPTEFSQ